MKTKIRKTYNYLIRFVIIIATYYFVYREIFYKKDLAEVFDLFKELFTSTGFVFQLFIIFLLMFVNLGLESWKWKYLIKKIESIPFFTSYQGVLTGISVSAFTPNRVGDYFGRVFILKKANHWEGILITIIGSMSQLITTLLLGSIAVLFFVPEFFDISEYFYGYFYYGLIAIVIIIDFFILLFYFNVSILTTFLQKFTRKKWKKFREHLSVFSLYSQKELLIVLLISIFRYLVFSFQFYLLLRLFSVSIPIYYSFVLVSVIYFVMAVIPTITLAELGIRGSVSIYFIGLFFEKYDFLSNQIDIGIFSASSTLWLINIIIPAIVGTVFVCRLKFFRKNST
ncbi:MAG: flippase-like domain-containing protein [Bacteroidales bacterium]|nr:flippase-like domain-containing protein [Bacteroidales bacterium]